MNDSEKFAEFVEMLRGVFYKLLLRKTGRNWDVRAYADCLDFQFLCRLGGFQRKTRSFDFTMAGTAKEWVSLLNDYADMLVAIWQNGGLSDSHS